MLTCTDQYQFLQIAGCDICQYQQEIVNRRSGEPNFCQESVHGIIMNWIEFVGPILPPGKDGSLFILTICDYFWKGSNRYWNCFNRKFL